MKKDQMIPASRDQVRSLKDAITLGSNDYKIDYSIIFADPDLDLRDDYGDLQELADSIDENGLIQPLIGDFVVNSKGKLFFILTDGFRRHRAIGLNIEQGREVGKIPVRLNEKGISLEDRFFKVFITQGSKPLTPLEISDVFSRLLKRGITIEEIQKRSCKSITYCKDMIELSKQTKYTKEAIKNRKTSPTAVVQLSKTLGADGTEDHLRKSIEGNIKVSVKDAETTVGSKKTEKKKVQIDMPFNIPETLDDMIKMRDELLAMKTRNKEQERNLQTLETRIANASTDGSPEKDYKSPFSKGFNTDGATQFDTILYSKFRVIFDDLLFEQGIKQSLASKTTMADKIFKFFKDETEPETK